MASIRRWIPLIGILVSLWTACTGGRERWNREPGSGGASAATESGGTASGGSSGGTVAQAGERAVSMAGSSTAGAAGAGGGSSAAGGTARAGAAGTAGNAENDAGTDPPPRWTCEPASYGDGTCHCGCGVVDVDCADASVNSCELCDNASCSPNACNVDADDNAHCSIPPSIWKCSPRLYRDGVRCDCGCGVVDPDCESSEADACDVCDVPGSCSAQACPGIIDENDNGSCTQPPPPDGWACFSNTYGDGVQCDCGCGVQDVDCRDTELATCIRCLSCGGHGVCEGTIDPTDSTQCMPPPSDWTCSAEAFTDANCDCGCGVLDTACQDIELYYVCASYPVEGCTGGHGDHLDPNHNASCLIEIPPEWTCDRSYYGDGICDCGCGAADLDCPSNEIDDCEFCDGEGSCSADECPGAITPDDAARCSE